MRLPQWDVMNFGCIARDAATFVSLMRTALSGSLPAPFVSRTGDSSAPLELDFTIAVSEVGLGAWEQWFTYDLADGALPFTIVLPWGTASVEVRARLVSQWSAQATSSLQWLISARMQIERESLPLFSGGLN